MAPNFSFEMEVQQISRSLLLLWFCFSFSASAISDEEKYNCQKPECFLLSPSPGQQVMVIINIADAFDKLRIFCHPGQERTWYRLWINPRISIEGSGKIAPYDLSIYYGRNVSDVTSQSSGNVFFGFNSWLLLKEEHSFSPFNLSCIGLTSTKSYSVHFRIKNPELWYLAYIGIGAVVFFFAPSWSRNVAFHYGTGMTVGVLASVLIVMFLFTRLMPQRLKTVSYVVMAVSSSASLFMFQLVRNYLQEIIQDHWQLALGYVLVSALLSFAFVYRFGPITDGRTLSLVCWLMQGCGLILIYQGTQIPEASAAIILLVVIFYMCPKATPQWLRRLRFRLFPPRHRFLTEEEYIQQADVETKKALKELREFCCSPKCDAWKVISHLESPSRFAKFVAGESHVSDAEIDEHETFIHYDRFSNRNYSHNLDDSDDSDREFSLHHRSYHSGFRNPHNDIESEIEDTVPVYQGNRYR